MNILLPNQFIHKISILIGLIALWNGFDLLDEKISIIRYMNYTL